MLSVDDALSRILARLSLLPEVQVPIADALGLVAARDITSGVNVPPYRNSAMDGYAVRHQDTQDVPVTLRVVGTVAAGSITDRIVGPGEAIRIMTGAPVPEGADAVVRFEETDELSRVTDRDRASIAIARAIGVSENVREAGEDIRSGHVVIPAGRAINPAAIGVLASIGNATVPVHRRPKVAILSTGDELVDVSTARSPSQIRDSNGPMLCALVTQAGGEAIPLGIARDTADDLRAGLSEIDRFDLILTSGGVSVGDYDIVKDVLGREGTIDAWQVRMKPGKPLAFGTLRATPLLGLPGNPVAAFVSFQQFGGPAIRRMLGHARLMLPEIDATVTEPLDNRGRRRHFVRAVAELGTGAFAVTPVSGQGSGQLMSVVRGNCLIVLAEDQERVEAGSTVRVQLFNDTAMFQRRSFPLSS